MEKKILKINKMILIIIALMMFVNVFYIDVFAADNIVNPNNYKVNNLGNSQNAIKTVGAIVNVIQILGIIIAICSIGILGIKYMTGSLEQRAEYKKTLLPFIVGVALITAIVSIVKLIYQITSKNIT